MKVFAPFLIAYSLFSPVVFGATVEVSASEVFDASAQGMVTALLSFDDTCDSGCKYTIKGLQETRVIAENEYSAIIWQHVESVKTVKQFVKIEFEFTEGGGIAYRSYLPDSDTIAALQAKFDLPHETAFKSMNINWFFSQNADGKTVGRGSLRVEHSFPKVVNPLIKRAMKNSFNEILVILRQAA
tara:strand:- start:182 stop:736 length:555 start_codon:yes stop_codon:yes gene_type:complete